MQQKVFISPLARSALKKLNAYVFSHSVPIMTMFKPLDHLNNGTILISQLDQAFSSTGIQFSQKERDEIMACAEAKTEGLGEGHFLNDEYESGKLYSENREYYNGPFKNGKKEGKGVEYYKDGKIKYEGKFLDGKYEDDNGKYYYETGEIYTGQFKNGKIFGIGNKTKDNKVIHELKDGPDTEFDIIKRNLVLNLINIGKGILEKQLKSLNQKQKNIFHHDFSEDLFY